MLDEKKENELIPLITTSIIPIIILALYFFNQNNSIVKHFIPRLLSDREHSKESLRQAGVGCLCLSAWLIGIIAAVSSTIDSKIIERMVWPLALLYFVLPLILMMFFCIGVYYLAIGVLAKENNVRPKLQSIFSAEKANLELDVKKMKLYTALNLSFLFMTILSVTINIVFEEYVGEKLIPFNVLFLIGFILTLWRVRTYITKTAQAMDLSGKKYLLTTLFHPIGIFFVWIHSFKLIKMFKNTNKSV